MHLNLKRPAFLICGKLLLHNYFALFKSQPLHSKQPHDSWSAPDAMGSYASVKPQRFMATYVTRYKPVSDYRIIQINGNVLILVRSLLLDALSFVILTAYGAAIDRGFIKFD